MCQTKRLKTKPYKFLNENQPEGDIPVLLEEIIEFNLGLEIRPVRGLKVRFGYEGAISHDRMTILVDEEAMLRFLNRYHFTLAHEISRSICMADTLNL